MITGPNFGCTYIVIVACTVMASVVVVYMVYIVMAYAVLTKRCGQTAWLSLQRGCLSLVFALVQAVMQDRAGTCCGDAGC